MFSAWWIYVAYRGFKYFKRYPKHARKVLPSQKMEQQVGEQEYGLLKRNFL